MSRSRRVASATAMATIFGAGIWVGVGGAGQDVQGATTLGLTAQLNAAQEVPKPKGVRTTARGSFAAGLVRVGTGGRISWRLTFQNLTGRAVASHIHFGRRGVAGPVAVALCGPCRSGARGIKTVNGKTVKALLAGTAYVNVHTARNPAGEIRGQVVRTAKVPPPPATTTTAATTGTTTYDYP